MIVSVCCALAARHSMQKNMVERDFNFGAFREANLIFPFEKNCENGTNTYESYLFVVSNGWITLKLPPMVKSAVVLIAFFIFQAKAFSQTSRSVCNVTINEKPYILSPEKDSLTIADIVKGGKLLTPGNNYTIMSFQVKDKNGQKQVLQNRTFYIKAGPPKVETTTLK